jgi:hypothetical protein
LDSRQFYSDISSDAIGKTNRIIKYCEEFDHHNHPLLDLVAVSPFDYISVVADLLRNAPRMT